MGQVIERGGMLHLRIKRGGSWTTQATGFHAKQEDEAARLLTTIGCECHKCTTGTAATRRASQTATRATRGATRATRAVQQNAPVVATRAAPPAETGPFAGLEEWEADVLIAKLWAHEAPQSLTPPPIRVDCVGALRKALAALDEGHTHVARRLICEVVMHLQRGGA